MLVGSAIANPDPQEFMSSPLNPLPQLSELRSVPTPPDRLVISGLRIYSYSGYAAAERELGQWFEVEFEVWGDLQPAALSGQLSDTYDYRRAIEHITHLLSSQSFSLIESMAESIARLLLCEIHTPQVRVKLSKCHPPIPGMTGAVTVEIHRRSSSTPDPYGVTQEHPSFPAE